MHTLPMATYEPKALMHSSQQRKKIFMPNILIYSSHVMLCHICHNFHYVGLIRLFGINSKVQDVGGRAFYDSQVLKGFISEAIMRTHPPSTPKISMTALNT